MTHEAHANIFLHERNSLPSEFVAKRLLMSLTDLPTELVYRLFDFLNAGDILLSFRLVSRRFHLLAESYDRLRIELNSLTSRRDAERLCRLLQSSSVVALNWHESPSFARATECYAQSARLDRFHRLRSLNLWDIDELFIGLMIPPLVASAMLSSVTIGKLSMDPWGYAKTSHRLSPLIALESLRELTLDIHARITDDLLWPHRSSIEKLTLRGCTYRQFCEIFDRSPNLDTFVLNESSMRDIDTDVRPTMDRSLTSLTLKNIDMSMTHLEFFLSLQPRLISLRLRMEGNVSWEHFQRFIQWEPFLRSKLPHLAKLDLPLRYQGYQVSNVESILSPLCSAFWLEEKQWFFVCQYSGSGSRKQVDLSPCTSSNRSFPDFLTEGGLSYAITTRRSNNINGRMWEARMKLSWLINTIDENEVGQSDRFPVPDPDYLRHLSGLALDIDADAMWSLELLERLSSSIDVTQLHELWILEAYPQILEFEAIEYLLEQASQLRTFGITYNGLPLRIVRLGRIVSGRIEHFNVRNADLLCVEAVLKHIRRISTITFEVLDGDTSLLHSIIDYLILKRIQYSVDYRASSIHIQLDSSGMNRGLKRKRTVNSVCDSTRRRKIEDLFVVI